MQRLRLDKIRLDGGTQMRVGPRNQEAVREYADALQEGLTLPPVTVFFDGRDYWLADGFHRHSAHLLIDWKEIDADVREGEKRDAILHAVGANASHGLRRTNADKRRAVEALLKDDEWVKWSNREIARRCAVDEGTVRNLRQSICGNSADTPRTVQRGGTTFTQNTGNIGQRPTSTPLEPEPVIMLVDSATGEVIEDAPPVAPYIPFNDPAPVRHDHVDELDLRNDRLDELGTALNRLVKFEREGRHLLSLPQAQLMGIRRVAYAVREMLDDWMPPETEQQAKTITVDALN